VLLWSALERADVSRRADVRWARMRAWRRQQYAWRDVRRGDRARSACAINQVVGGKLQRCPEGGGGSAPCRIRLRRGCAMAPTRTSRYARRASLVNTKRCDEVPRPSHNCYVEHSSTLIMW